MQGSPPGLLYRPHAQQGGPSVLYVEDFDDPPRDDMRGDMRDEPPAIAAPVFSAADLQAARTEGHAAGLDEARVEHATLQAALCHAALASIADALTAARGDAASVAERNADEISAGVLGLLTAALPVTAARLAAAEIDGLLTVLLPPLMREPGVTLHVHPDLLPCIASRIGRFSGVTAAGDPDMAPSDVTIAWQDGEAKRDWGALWTGIAATLAPFGLPPDLAALLPGLPSENAPPGAPLGTQSLAAQNPGPQNPVPQNPVPQNHGPQNPGPHDFATQNLATQNLATQEKDTPNGR